MYHQCVASVLLHTRPLLRSYVIYHQRASVLRPSGRVAYVRYLWLETPRGACGHSAKVITHISQPAVAVHPLLHPLAWPLTHLPQLARFCRNVNTGGVSNGMLPGNAPAQPRSAVDERTWWIQMYRPRAKGGPNPAQMKAGHDLFAKNGWHQKWPLHFAAMRGDVNQIRSLCDWNGWAMDPSTPMSDSGYAEPIHFAAQYGQLEACKALVILEADPFRQPNMLGNTPESDSVQNNHNHVTVFFLDLALREMKGTFLKKIMLDSTQQLGVAFNPNPNKKGACIKSIDPYGQAAFKYQWLRPGQVVMFMNSTPISGMKMDTIMHGAYHTYLCCPLCRLLRRVRGAPSTFRHTYLYFPFYTNAVAVYFLKSQRAAGPNFDCASAWRDC